MDVQEQVPPDQQPGMVESITDTVKSAVNKEVPLPMLGSVRVGMLLLVVIILMVLAWWSGWLSMSSESLCESLKELKPREYEGPSADSV
jgi:hypothetical protein